MAKILIITARFAPFIGPRAHRWAALAGYFAAQGFEVHVVCPRCREDKNQAPEPGLIVHRTGFDTLKELIYFIFRISSGRGRVGVIPDKPDWFEQIFNRLYERIWKKTAFPDDSILWYWSARRKAFGLCRRHKFEAVITVSLPFAPHLVGLALKKRYPHLLWLADIGDPFSFQPRFKRARGKQRATDLEGELLRNADRVTVTTPSLSEKYVDIFGEPLRSKLVAIPPLLHPPMTAARAINPVDGKVQIGYFGTFYVPVRTPGVVINLLNKTWAARPDWQERVSVHFYGEIFPEFVSALLDTPAVTLHGLQARDVSRNAMLGMHGLLHIGNTTDYQLPSKSAEYLASGKPVFHLSYVENDPFIAFWENQPGLDSVSVLEGALSEEGFEIWLNWVEGLLAAPGNCMRTTQACLLETVGRDYLRCLDLSE
ncbi:MAG: glycosyltransferase [Saprospiraceae bacterium]|nr:glycosyltransferase [Saprospiraceae bacterium]